MGLAIASFTHRIFSPPAAAPIVREPNRRWARVSARPRLLRLEVAEVIIETPTTRTFVFADESLAYVAGQHLTVVAEVDGRTHRRCYSFSSSPAAGGRPSITVKRVEGGVLSGWLHEHVRAGDVLRAAPPSGRFAIDGDTEAGRRYVMIAGGVGITPILSMTETILRTQTSSQVTLLYGSRGESEIIFRERIESMRRGFAGRFDVVLALDDAPQDWTGIAGPLDGSRVLAVTKEHSADEWFVCGPQPMMDSIVAALSRSGVAGERIHLERFQYAEPSAVTMPAQAASLVFAASSRAAIAPSGVTILEAAEAAGIVLPSSCRMGGCGACKIKVDGRVVAAEPNCLTDSERAEGYALACCSYGDGRVVLRDY